MSGSWEKPFMVASGGEGKHGGGQRKGEETRRREEEGEMKRKRETERENGILGF
jgi:hypothetical protein